MTPYFERDHVALYLGTADNITPALGPVDLVLTDPPYALGAGRSEWRATASVALGLNAAARAVVKGGALFTFTTTSGRGIEYTLGAVAGALPFNRLLVWHKTFVRSRVAGPWRWDAVSILAFGRASFGRPEHSSVFTSVGPATKKALGGTGHPAELPEGIADWLWTPFQFSALTTLDPFCGTGQLLMPAIRAGQRAIGVEVEEKWAEVAARRFDRILDGNEPEQLPLEAAS